MFQQKNWCKISFEGKFEPYQTLPCVPPSVPPSVPHVLNLLLNIVQSKYIQKFSCFFQISHQNKVLTISIHKNTLTSHVVSTKSDFYALIKNLCDDSLFFKIKLISRLMLTIFYENFCTVERAVIRYGNFFVDTNVVMF